MTNEAIKEYITAKAPTATYDETGEWLNILVESTHFKSLATILNGQPMQMNFLFCLGVLSLRTEAVQSETIVSMSLFGRVYSEVIYWKKYH